ncbi:uncharacterized protein RJT20DRAFT_48997 [Scheffersomyces xylosifermentans]|uniref:uncharacterized protein n=1 Tax=Scheffersomyces xylosifermentans TaxID=1304137 RepID=UPI00315D7EA0
MTSKVGHPTNQYEIKYSASESSVHNGNWYLILTSKNYHFYFNKALKKSFWQLADLAESFDDLDIDEFVKAIEFDVVALLTARNVGLKGLDNYYFKKDQKVQDARKESTQDAVVDESRVDTKRKQEGEDVVVSSVEEEEDKEEDEDEDEEDDEARNQFIRNLLQEEGFLKENEQERKGKEETEPSKPSAGLVSGYSSSEDEDEDEIGDQDDVEDEKDVKEDHKHPSESDNVILNETRGDQLEAKSNSEDENSENSENENSGLDLDLSEEEVNEGIDLDLDGNEVEEDNELQRQEFKRLLDRFSDRISPYDSWPLIEEELISEFVKCAEFYAIEDANKREAIFDEWCQSKQDQEVLNPSGPEEDDSPKKYPTDILQFYNFLQGFKKEIKTSFYQEFYNKHHQQINDIDLAPKVKDSNYRKFKLMIAEQSEFEKRAKKTESFPTNVNLKKFKLDEFLASRLTSVPVQDKEFIRTIQESEDSDFDKWITLINRLDLAEDLVEDCINFVVGDEKRLQAYIDIYNKLTT